MDPASPVQATSDSESTMMIVTPKGKFHVAKEVYVQPEQETSPPGSDELVQ